MNLKSSFFLPNLMPVIYLVLSFLYIVFIIQPVLHFHYWQPPFINSSEFFTGYLKHPGGFSELIATMFMQSFSSNLFGPITYMLALFIIWILIYSLLRGIFKSRLNLIWASIPVTLLIALSNNFNFQFSILFSILFILAFLSLLQKTGKKTLMFLVLYVLSATGIYYLNGSGYFLLFSVCSLFLLPKIKWKLRLGIVFFIVLFSATIPWLVSRFVYSISPRETYNFFYTWKPYFLDYKPGIIFYIFLLSIPFLFFVLLVISKLNAKRWVLNQPKFKILKFSLAAVIILSITLLSHQVTFQPDKKQIVEADYYCYTNNPEKTLIAATTLKEYSFAANLNFNLVMAKTGKLNDYFFEFFQIKGTEALYPDVVFASEMSFIATDFYYDLGYISEARHWAYESLVNFPASQRALQKLAKIHFVTREYKAAERCLSMLKKGITGKDFVRKYLPYINDTSLINSDKEIIEKRSFIPVEQELDPKIENRFKQLLEANPKNKRAYEYLMMYYLLDAQLNNFVELYNDWENYYKNPVDIYEEALLMYKETMENDLILDYKIRNETQARYNKFKEKWQQYKGNTRLARNEMYREYGDTYMYYFLLVEPIIVEPEYIIEDEGEPTI